MPNGPEPRVRYGGSVELVSVGHGLIELEFGDRLRIRGIESGELIEPEVGLGWDAGGTQEGRPAGKIEVGVIMFLDEVGLRRRFRVSDELLLAPSGPFSDVDLRSDFGVCPCLIPTPFLRPRESRYLCGIVQHPSHAGCAFGCPAAAPAVPSFHVEDRLLYVGAS